MKGTAIIKANKLSSILSFINNLIKDNKSNIYIINQIYKEYNYNIDNDIINNLKKNIKKKKKS